MENNIITLDQLQKEVGEWSRRNFPNNKPHHPLLGIIEECGEMDDAINKHNGQEADDAVGDITIYLADYCERNNIKMSEAFSKIEPDQYLMDGSLYLILGKMCHYHLKGEQGIRYSENQIILNKMIYIGNFLWKLDRLFINWQEIYTQTWLKVKQRDWQKNPIKAAEIVENNSDSQ